MKVKLRRLTCLLLCFIVSFAALAPPAAQAVVVEAAMVYKLAEVLIVGCGVYHWCTSDATQSVVDSFFDAAPAAKTFVTNYAHQVADNKLRVTRDFLNGMDTFYDKVKTFFIDTFGSNGGNVAFAPFAGNVRELAKTWQPGKVLVKNGAPPQIYKEMSLDGVATGYKFFVGVQPYYQNGGKLVNKNTKDTSYEFPAFTTSESYDGAVVSDVVVDHVSDTGSEVYLKYTSYDGLTANTYINLPDVNFIPISSNLISYTVDQTLGKTDVIDGWSRDFPDASVDPDAKAPVINIPADAGALTGAKAGDVWPKQDAGEVVVPGSPTLGNVYDRLGSLQDICSGVKTGVDSLTGTLEGVNVGVGTIAGAIGAIKDFIDSIRKALENFFDSPTDFHLNFDGFKSIILPDRFPFCIPFDFIKAVKVFAAATQDFHFNIDLKTEYFEVHHEVNLSPFAIPIAFFRYIVVIWFIWILLTRTRDMMKW